MNLSPAIHLEEVSVGYDGKTVLQGVSLTIPGANFVGLLGANGSGKTTLLKSIAGIVPPQKGAIRFDPASAVTGYVPQRESLDSTFMFSSIEIVQMGLCGRVPPGRFYQAPDREWSFECLRRARAENLARKPFSHLSGGQKQKVLIARALTARPDILLLDEPTAGVDPESTSAIENLLSELNQSGMTILMVNHDLPAVRRITQSILRVRDGKVSQGETTSMFSENAFEAISVQRS